jgi:CRISPR-associated protein Cas1
VRLGLKLSLLSYFLGTADRKFTPVVDRLVLKLFNRRILSEYDFKDDEFGQITLNDDGFHRFCFAYEKWMTGTDPEAGEHFRSKIRQQAAALKRSLKQNTMYQPYRWKQEDVSGQL